MYLHLQFICCRLLALGIENNVVSFTSSLCNSFKDKELFIFPFQKLKQAIVLIYSFLESQFSRIIVLALSSELVEI